MKKLVFFAVLCVTVFMGLSFLSCSSQAPQAKLKTDIDSLSYAYGVQITQGLDQYLQQMGIEGAAAKEEFYKSFMEGSSIDKKDTAAISRAVARAEGVKIGIQVFTRMLPGINGDVFGSDSTQSLNREQFLAGFIAAAQNKKLLLNKDEVPVFVQTKTAAIQAKVNEPLKATNQAFLDENKKKEGVVALPSGLQYKVEKDASGIKPTAEDTVIVKYLGTNIKGEKFDSNDSAKFVLNQVVKGWTEGIQLMSPGAKYTFYIPYNLAYGEQGRRPQIAPYATLIFDVELLNVLPKK
jgi:FKBP-type peptidyl-prolyl cis-trans isomerase FklB